MRKEIDYVTIDNEYRKKFEEEDDVFAILQIKDFPDRIFYSFESLEDLKEHGLSVKPENYQFRYVASIPVSVERGKVFGKIYEIFNLCRPDNFYGHSLSISDIIAIKEHGAVSFHYVDKYSFEKLPDFMIESEDAHVDTEKLIHDLTVLKQGVESSTCLDTRIIDQAVSYIKKCAEAAGASARQAV